MSDIDQYTNLIIDLIDLNESILESSNYSTLLDKRSEALKLYDKYDALIAQVKLTEAQQSTLELLEDYLQQTNMEVIGFLEKKVINLRIKQRILEDRRKDMDF